MSSQSFEREREDAIDVGGGSLRDATGMDRLVAFLMIEPIKKNGRSSDQLTTLEFLIQSSPCDISKLLESLTTLVHRNARSLPAVKIALPSSP